MRLLRYIGQGATGDGIGVDSADLLLVEDAHDGERFGLFLDDSLRAALTGPAAPAPASVPPPPPPPPAAHQAPSAAAPLTPREIQMRVRAGETPEALALEAGVSPDRITRFAYAVLQERLRVGAEARRARARRGGPEGELLPFGEVVDARFEEHGISAQDVRWDAVRDGDGPWTVIATWRSGEADSSARWSFLLGARTMVPDDDTAMELLSDRPVQRHHGAPVAMAAVPMPAAADDDADASATLRRLPPRADDQFFDQDAPADGQGEPPAPSFAGLRAVPSRAPAAPTAPPPPQLGAFFDNGAPSVQYNQHSDPILPFELPGDRPAPERALVEADDLLESQELTPAPRTVEPIGESPDAEDEESTRARIPSWDDILLGVRRKRD